MKTHLIFGLLSTIVIYNKVFGYIELKQMMEDVEFEPIEIKRMFTGPHLHPHYQTNGNKLHIHFKCSVLYQAQLENTSIIQWPPPKEVPKELYSAYTFNGTIPVISWWMEERQNGGTGYVWSKEYIESLGRGKNICGGYKKPHCGVTIEKYKHLVQDKIGMVFGSQWPWAEGALLVAGQAKHITTIEYMNINTTHPQLSTYRPDQLAEMYLKGKVELVDFAFSYSSFEHDGLGRYGDPLNPYGDLEAIARVHCLLKPGGIFFLGVGVGPDAVVWNAHRIYGRHRLSVILANWEPLDLIGADYRINEMKQLAGWQNQPVWVLRKRELPIHSQEYLNTITGGVNGNKNNNNSSSARGSNMSATALLNDHPRRLRRHNL